MDNYYHTNISTKPPKNNRVLFFCSLALFLIIGFAGGYFLRTYEDYQLSPDASLKKDIFNKADNKQLPSSFNYLMFWQVWDTVLKKYVREPVDENKMFYGALAGVVASLQDPYSVFLDPELTKKFNDEIDGDFEGIGAQIDIKDDRIVVVAALPDTPAAKADLRSGDIILAIDQLDTVNISLDYAVDLIRGEKGTTVTLLIQRTGEEVQEIKIIRDTIQIDSVTWEMKEKNGQQIAYINITNFSADTATKFNEAINEILLKQPAGIVLDLRNNPGGLLDQSIEIASHFISSGVIVSEQFSNGSKNDYSASGNANLQGFKTVVLVDEGSASASEIVAGALQDYGVARLIGQKTFGKGSVQNLEQLPDGSSLKLTVALWYTPKGRSINETGIEPDEKVEMKEENYQQKQDPQLDRALEYLSNR